MNDFSKKRIRQVYVRLVKHHGSPESIGRGAAIGLMVGFLIPFSLQMAVAFPLALLLKGAKLPALLFTWVSNPLTIPFLYPVQCFVGSYLTGRPFSYEALKDSSATMIETPTVSAFLTLGAELALSFLAGGFFFGSMSALAGYLIVVYSVRSYRKKKLLRMARKKQRATIKKVLTNETC